MSRQNMTDMMGPMDGAELKAIRLATGLTQERFAPVVGKTTSEISRWERGIRRIPDEKALWVRAKVAAWRAHGGT